MYSNPLVFLPVVEPLLGLPVAILVVVLTIGPRGVCSADERKPFEGAECFEELNQRVVDKLNASEFTGIHRTTPRFLRHRVYLGGLSASALPIQRVPVVQRPQTHRGKLGGEKFTSSLGLEKCWHTNSGGADQ